MRRWAPSRHRRPPRRLSVATRLAASVVGVTALTVAVTSIVGVQSGRQATDRLLEQRLASIRSAEAFELTSYVESTRGIVAGLAASPMTADSLERFATSFAEVEVPDRADLADQRDELADHLAAELVPVLSAASARPVGPRDLVPETDVGVHLHHLVLQAIVEPDGSLGATSPRDVDDPGGDSRWAALHADLHPHYRTVATRLGADDLTFVAIDGTVVYSVDKAPDFATNLRTGPYSGSTLATVFRTFAAGDRDPVVTDLAAYEPALGRPSWFVAAPVVTDGRLRGMVAARLGVAPLNEALADGAGGDGGFGETGEVYLAGGDGRLRSDPRGYREAPGAYLAAARDAATLSEAEIARVRTRGSTALLQRTDADLVGSATTGASPGASAGATTDVVRRVDHLGRPAVMTAAPFDVAGLGWVIVAQITADEADRPVTDARRLLLVVAAIVMTLVTFGAVAWSNRVIRPVRLVSERLRERRSGGDTAALDVAVARSDARAHGCDEFRRLVDSFATMDSRLLARRHEIELAHREWLDVLRSLLPAAVAERIDEGDRSVFDRAPSASVAVIVLHGSEHGTRADAVIATIDRLAERHGLERVKLVGDSCYCAVGHQRPVLDHARRAVLFAQALVSTVSSELPDHGGIRPAVGVASGSMNVGLSGSVKLVYDVWGPTVGEAYSLARRAAPGEVVWSDATADRLPDDLMAPAGNGDAT